VVLVRFEMRCVESPTPPTNDFPTTHLTLFNSFVPKFNVMEKLPIPSTLQTRTTTRCWKFWQMLKQCLLFLAPSFVNIEPKQPQGLLSSKQQLRSTAYLDGLKGIFAVIVFIRHYTIPWNKNIDLDYRSSPNFTYFQLPIVRILYSGPTIPVFFAISGYVLSRKPMEFIHTSSNEKLLNYMAAGIFKRGMRLFGPPICSSLVVVVLLQLGLYSFHYDSMTGQVPLTPARKANFAMQLSDWIAFLFYRLTNIWTWEYQNTSYDGHLWSIPVQYRCSILLYVILTGLSQVRIGYRMLISLVFAIYTMWIGRWEVFVYIAGMILGEHDLLRSSQQSDTYGSSRKLRRIFLLTEMVCIIGFTFALYLASFPRSPDTKMQFYSILYSIETHYTKWHSCGTILMLITLARSSFLQSIFTNSILLYLGDISFGIYLCHGPVLHVIGYRLVVKIANLFHRPPGEGFGFALGLILLFPIVIWTADLFRRIVQKGCTKFSDWITSCISVENAKHGK
jgi:peptidoglycan/LPS O-acetylase OafA/YrhL